MSIYKGGVQKIYIVFIAEDSVKHFNRQRLNQKLMELIY